MKEFGDVRVYVWLDWLLDISRMHFKSCYGLHACEIQNVVLILKHLTRQI